MHAHSRTHTHTRTRTLQPFDESQYQEEKFLGEPSSADKYGALSDEGLPTAQDRYKQKHASFYAKCVLWWAAAARACLGHHCFSHCPRTPTRHNSPSPFFSPSRYGLR
jgi:hypothetical protein